MLININVSPSGVPPHTYVPGIRPILFERFPDNSAYALNAEHPSGVFYLRPAAADRLAEALRRQGNPPVGRISSLVSRSPAEELLLGKLLTPNEHQPLTPAARPLNVWLHLSNCCNLACSYCYIPQLQKAVTAPTEGSVTTPKELSAGIKSLFMLCADRGFSGLHLRIAGGEPLLALDAIELACQIATDEADRSATGLTFAILTNGTLMSDRFLRLLKRYRFTGISISIDGADTAHDEIRFETIPEKRERKGTWGTIFRNIRILKDHGHSPYILTTLTANNHFTIDGFVDTCIEHKLGFRLSPIRDHNTAWIPGLQDAIVRTLAPIYQRLAERLPITRPIQNYANFAEWAPGVKKSTACGTCRSSFAVGQHGDVSTCQMRLDKTYGNITTDSASTTFDRMIKDPGNWRFTAPKRMSGGCSQCMWRYTCSGGCPEHTMATYGTYDLPSPWCKLYGDFLPIYFRAIAMQIKVEADRIVSSQENTKTPD